MTRIASDDPETARRDANLRALLDAYERAAIDAFEARGIPDNDWDDETQADIDDAKVEAANRLLRIRTRLFKMASYANMKDSAVITNDLLREVCNVARRDEINRAADWMLGMGHRCLDLWIDSGSPENDRQWAEAQTLLKYAALLRDMSPFPYVEPEGVQA